MSFLNYIVSEQVITQVVSGFPFWGLLVLMAVCLAVLSKGADWMIDGAVALAQGTGLPRIIIGATIISLGTTMPEAFVSVLAAWTGNPGLALGNGVGSIICDTGLIFGVMCLISRVPVRRFILNRTGWVQVGSATILVLFAHLSLYISPGAPTIGRGVGVLFLLALGVYLYFSYRWAKQSGLPSDAEFEHQWGPGKSVLFIFMGLVGVVAGSRVLIPVAAEGALRLGVPQDIIAATLVAFGTSLPELVTAISAVKKGHPQIMVGNVVGADVLNCLFVLGAASIARPLEIPPNFFYYHFPAMLLILYSFRVFIFINTDGWFKRWQGGFLLSLYAIYIVLQYSFSIAATHS
ncbi:sodium:calcium antiporter [Desulfoferula mesophila]|uniref:Sodium/hydrogen exchanger n=1 Tax=Desulfoferula mesophila TaxID=3058419 RepID=A0AAU9ELX4_9BACT|nr:sodium/hydrogen exchanger [Desulfoferula mesophilus]